MQLVDLNQILISNIMIELAASVRRNQGASALNVDLVRHMALNSLRSYRGKFYEKYGELVIACDSKAYWRKKFFPYYKAQRKAARTASAYDWNEIFAFVDTMKQELREYFPYKVIEVENAEADDIIASICMFAREPILVISGDKDFQQLQRYQNVSQYNPVQKHFIVADDPLRLLKGHIIRGDKLDGIPNMLSSDSCIVDGKRQTPISKRNLATWLLQEPTVFCTTETMRYGYQRNKVLIDMSLIPLSLQEKIRTAFEQENTNGRKKLFAYFMEKRLDKHMSNAGDF